MILSETAVTPSDIDRAWLTAAMLDPDPFTQLVPQDALQKSYAGVSSRHFPSFTQLYLNCNTEDLCHYSAIFKMIKSPLINFMMFLLLLKLQSWTHSF